MSTQTKGLAGLPPARIRQMQKTVEKAVQRVAITRDWIRDQINEMEALKDSCDRAWDSLNEAVDALSELA